MEHAARLLSDWYRRHARVLPWRQTRDPYAIWISEVMLQQTQVATVIPYYHRFLELFPTIRALAEAPEEAVLTAWSGLGYYSRARNLRHGARYLLDRYRGAFPHSRERLLEVPGIGPYTAGAVLSIAFDLPVPLVDGNVQRVFARYYGVQEEIHTRAAQSFFWEKAQAFVQAAESPRVLNQGLMELGATVCIKGKPHCVRCPLNASCVAEREDRQLLLPRKKERRKTIDLWWVGLILEADGKIFLRKNAKGEWWSDLWDFPRVAVKSRRAQQARFPGLVKELGEVTGWEELDHQKHTVTHHRIHVAPYRVRLARAQSAIDGSWFEREELEKLPVSSLVRKVVHSYF